MGKQRWVPVCLNKLQNKASEDVDVTSQIKMLRSVQVLTSKSTALPAFEVLMKGAERPPIDM